MVVIEPVFNGDETTSEKISNARPSSDQSTTSEATVRAKTLENSASGVGRAEDYASDGFETASETELDDDAVGEVKEEQRQKNDENSADCCEKKPVAAPMAALDRETEGQQLQEQKLQSGEGQVDEKALTEASNAKLEGNALFKDGLYEEALVKYEMALQIVPNGPSSGDIRSVCHANRAACYSKLGKFEETIKECTKALEINPNYIKALLRRGEAHEKLDHFEEAITDMTKILDVDPSNDQARRNVVRLKPLANEKREKMKEEMIGKLKEMGNSVLGRFNMSLDNFKAVKDPNTGSYSISFQQ